MLQGMRARKGRLLSLASVAVCGVVLASCAGQSPVSTAKLSKRSKEYFPESVYGVKASPLVVADKTARVPRGGGRDQLGKPYKVRGKWYKPKEDPDYVKVGAASWYGDAFHGRLTANGEVYDMTHLTAAHPTMPLPSYARVTNTTNGSSVIVRVNDRGPYANDRIIDLSKRAAELLDYQHAGVAKVKVEYVGRAPLHGQDDQYLMASYRPGKGGSPFDLPGEIATGVMIAMNGPTPTARAGAADAFASTGLLASAGDLALPAFGPAVPERPEIAFEGTGMRLASLSYADQRIARSADPFAAFGTGMTPSQIVSAWERSRGASAAASPSAPYVAVGTFDDRDEAEALARVLAAQGAVEFAVEPAEGTNWYTVALRSDGRSDIDSMLQAAWAAGASEAMIVRE
ncbi:septal ring lytic transglycosylase RlpA family protein [Aquibium microcysteis]|uniref:septal ring lytic transglycosylase RlpA family protein n=1 Tax=Aquibium microcysteis TaxID=675281 RepID=UPI00165CF2AF|nr:septal ring lytic transglycosylase RlpA family protein [Aquibium microcysteis]